MPVFEVCSVCVVVPFDVLLLLAVCMLEVCIGAGHQGCDSISGHHSYSCSQIGQHEPHPYYISGGVAKYKRFKISPVGVGHLLIKDILSYNLYPPYLIHTLIIARLDSITYITCI
jgi:hypothetical protein